MEDGYFHQRKEVTCTGVRGGQFRSETFLLLVLPGGLLASVKAVVSTGRQPKDQKYYATKSGTFDQWGLSAVGPLLAPPLLLWCCSLTWKPLGNHPRKHTSDKLSITYDRFCKTDFVKFVQVLESRHCERPAVCELMIFERRHCCAFLSETVAVVLGHYCCSAVSKYNHCTTLLCCN